MQRYHEGLPGEVGMMDDQILAQRVATKTGLRGRWNAAPINLYWQRWGYGSAKNSHQSKHILEETKSKFNWGCMVF